MDTKLPDESPLRCDLAIIGGGINGLAVAREAALQGFQVVVIERGDLGGETTAWSSRLIHGGLKYLERYEWQLVAESAAERRRLLRTAPHLVHPYPMLVPFYEQMSRSGPVIRAGMLIHDLLAIGDGALSSRWIRRSVLERHWPGVSTEGLRGAAMFTDGQVPWPERLCVELALSAHRAGARILTRTEAVGLDEDPTGRVTGVTVRDVDDGREASVVAEVVINAAGPWVDRLLSSQFGSSHLLGGTKGSHVVVDHFPGAPKTCLFFEAAADQRPMFVMPWTGRYLIGTTDLAVEGDPGEVRTSPDEVDYLLGEANRILPGAGLTADDVLFSYCGVRPLGFDPDATDHSEISRGHVIVDHAPQHPGLVSLTGGKLTTHRALAEDALGVVRRILHLPDQASPTRDALLPGAPLDPGVLEDRLAADERISAATAERLAGLYGQRATAVVSLLDVDPDLARVIDDQTQAIAAEVRFAVEHEGARSVGDILLRRTMLGFSNDVGHAVAPQVAEVLADVPGWDAERAQQSLASFATERARFQPRDLRQRSGATT